MQIKIPIIFIALTKRMGWKNIRERMLGIMKCFLVLVLEYNPETPSCPLTAPLVSADLRSGLWLLCGPAQDAGSVFTGCPSGPLHPPP